MRYSILSLLILVVSFCFGQEVKVEIKELNSLKTEYAPSISADGKTMILQSDRSGKYELYESKLGANGKWSLPAKLKGGINEYGKESDLIGGPSITFDGNRIYFFASFDGGYGLEDIYYSDRVGEQWSKPTNVGRPINSKNYEGFPNISSDGKSLYFMRYLGKLKGESRCYTMMVSHKNSKGEWQTPKELPAPLNTGCEKFPRIMSDNETLIYSSLRDDNMASGFEMYEAKMAPDGSWKDPKSMTFLNTKGHDYFAAISSKFDKLYTNLAVGNDFNIYSYDIPLEFKPDHQIVNIKGQILGKENMPIPARIRVHRTEDQKEIVDIDNNASSGEYLLVLPEGDFNMIITSEGYLELSSHIAIPKTRDYKLIEKDIKLNPLIQEVTVVATNKRDGEAIGATIEVTQNENQIVEINDNKFTAFFGEEYSISVKSNGYESAKSEFKIEDMKSERIEKRISLMPTRPEIKIMPRDADTKEPISVNFMLRDLTHKKTLFRGKLVKDSLMKLDFQSRFQLYAVSKNHLFVKDVLDLKELNGYQFIEYPLEMQAIKPGAKLTLDEIYFESGSAELNESSYDELAAVYNFLKRNKSVVVEISAHTDNVGSHHDNMKLSKERAKSVVDFIISKGIPASMMHEKGYGETQPIASNNSKEGRAKNRRVEFKVLKVRN